METVVYVVHDREGFLVGVFTTEAKAREHSDTITQCILDTTSIVDI